MAVNYKPVLWYHSKYIYDGVLILGIVAYIALYLYGGALFQTWLSGAAQPTGAPARSLPDDLVLRMRAFGSCAFILLSVILCIGPLARLDRRFLPLLYNRRHFGVITFSLAAVHASYVLGWYFNFSSIAPYPALLGSNTDFSQLLGFPFEVFGIVALVVLMVLAVTSHDFWLSFLSPPVWKSLHMMIYVAYAALVLHVGLGAFQADASPFFIALVFMSVFCVCGLHLVAALREGRVDAGGADYSRRDGFIVAGRVGDIANNRALVVVLEGDERVAIFRYSGKLSAVTNACAHQNGPLGEGRIIGGCITCPWHGYQYRPEDGCAPPPFREKLATYNLKLDGDLILLDPRANPPGTAVPPVHIPEEIINAEAMAS